ncbi:MAG: hypothetical protein ABIQ88_02250 [Chitinophagaceae bacterium]
MPNKFNNPLSVSAKDVLKELNREMDTRQRIYPRWKLEGKITADVASHRIACIAKAIEILNRQLPVNGNLFP